MINKLATLLFVMLFLNIICSTCFGAKDGDIKNAEKLLSTKSEKGFIENKGQMVDMGGKPVPFVLFKTEAPGLNFYVTETGITLLTFSSNKDEKENKEYLKGDFKKEENIKTEWERIDIILNDAAIRKDNIIKESPLQGHLNYFYPHCPDGIYDVKEYAKLTIKEVYKGIDWVVYRKKSGELKYDFVVHAGADYKDIELLYKSKTKIKANKKGQLELITRHGSVLENAPTSFLGQKEIKTKFKIIQQKLNEVNEDKGYETLVCFDLEQYDLTSKIDLIIDPELTWATFYGGNGADGPMSIDTDSGGNVFIAGYNSGSTDFPLQNTGTYFQGTSLVPDNKIFITKFNNLGVLLWSTLYGGSMGTHVANSIDVDGNENIVLTGYTSASDFPTQNSGGYFQNTYGGAEDVFVLKFNNSGVRLWATYYGGSGNDVGNSITTDAFGSIFITGSTVSANFPTVDGGVFFQPASSGLIDAFVLKFDNSGNCIVGSYLGGSSNDIGISITADIYNNIFIIGNTVSTDFPLQNSNNFFQGTYGGSTGFPSYAKGDMFIVKFDNFLNRKWATYFGGSSNELAGAVKTDKNGNLFITGLTKSTNFPTQNAGTYFQSTNAGGSDGFILKFDNLQNLVFSTYYGGNANEELFTPDNPFPNLSIDNCSNIYISFASCSDGLAKIYCDGGYQKNNLSNVNDVLLSLFDNNGNRLWSTYLGGDGAEFRQALAVDINNNLFMTGEWSSVTNNSSYPTINSGSGAFFDNTFNGGSDDGYILKISPKPISFNVTTSNPNCGSVCSGAAIVNSSSLCTNNSYLWSNSLTGQTINTLCPGPYSVTVTNQLCYDTILYFTISSVPTFSVSATISQPTCGNNDGSVTLTAIGGTGTFSYSWPNSATGTTATGLASGTYIVTVTDQNNCTKTASVSLNDSPSPIINTLTATPISCNGATSAVTVTITSTASPYTYSWSNGASNITTATSNQEQLTSNSYTITVTDQNGCNNIQSINITQPPAITILPPTTTATNCNQNNGAIQISITGGINPYTYSYSNGTSGSSTTSNSINQQFNNLTQGTYTLTITDNNNCTKTVSATINTNNAPAITSATPTNALCKGQTASASITISTTTGPYTYSWSNGTTSNSLTINNTTANISNLISGIYTITVIDYSGCSITTTVNIIEPTAINPITKNVTDATCNQGNGIITINAPTGGTPGYTYTWSNNSNNQNQTNIGAGTYTLTVKDNNNCTITTTATVSNINATPIASATSDKFTSNTINEGEATILSAGGGISYTWTPTGSLSCSICPITIANPTTTTTYTLIVSNQQGCTDTTDITIKVRQGCTDEKDVFVANVFSPGSANNNVLTVQGAGLTNIYFTIYDRWGNKVFESREQSQGWDGTLNGNIVNAGTYVYFVKAICKKNLQEVILKGNVSVMR